MDDAASAPASAKAPALPPGRTRRRNRAQTEADLRAAVEALLIEGGFGALTPSAVAKRAGVDKMLIYRYFGDLEGLVRSIAFGPDVFPSFEDLCDGRSVEEMLALPVGERAALVLERNVRALLSRPVVLELMVWELVERNALTAIMEEARETLGQRLMRELFFDVADPARMNAVGAVLSAGVTYLAIRTRKIRWYNGVDLKSEAGWAEISAAIKAMAAAI